MMREKPLREYRKGTQQGQENEVLLLLQEYGWRYGTQMHLPAEY